MSQVRILSLAHLLRFNTSLKSDTIQGMSAKRVLSGIRASGRLHLGNYLGAVKGMLALQDDPAYETFYMVADLHTLTTPYEKEKLEEQVKEVILDYLAAGLDPEKSVIFIQSQTGEHRKLAYLLATEVSVARMLHLPTYKDKLKENPDDASLSLLYYPVLMAADILAYKANLVPVGVDQEPHLEISRQIARKMNSKYGTNFPEPIRFETEGGYVPSLTGEGKMSKSIEGSAIYLTDSLDEIKSKIAKIPTDSGSGETVPKEGGVASLFTITELVMGKKERENLEQKYLSEGIRYGEHKEKLSKAIFEMLKPIQEKREYFENNPEKVREIIKAGDNKATEVSHGIVEEVSSKMGLCYDFLK